jgi:hypothetical protein
MGVRRIGFKGRIIGHKYFIHTIFSKLGSHCFHAGAQQDGAYLLTELIRQLPGRAGQFETDLAQGTLSLFCNYPYTFCHVFFLRDIL